MCTQPRVFVTLQLQPAGAVTFTLPKPPAEPNEALDWESETEHTVPPAAGGGIATDIGYGPIRGIVLTTVLLAMSSTDTVNEYSLTTQACAPSGVTATPVGIDPVGSVASKLPAPVSITETVPPLPLVASTRLPLGLAVIEFGDISPRMVFSRFPAESCTVTEEEYWLLTYTRPFGVTVTALGPDPAAKVPKTLFDAVSIMVTFADNKAAT